MLRVITGRRKLSAIVLLIAALAFAAAISAQAKPASVEPEAGIDYVDGHVLVKFKPGTPAVERAGANAALGAQTVATIPAIGVQVIDVGKGRSLTAIEAYSRNPNVEYAEVDGIARTTLDCTDDAGTFSNDSCSWRQWGLDNAGHDYDGSGPFAPGAVDADVDIPEAWASGADGIGVTIAVLDTGYDQTHEDLAARVDASADFTGDGIADLHGHGTWTATIAAGLTNNDLGIAGVAPGADLIVGKVLNNAGSGSWSWIANGIVWAADYTDAPTVISMSLGGSCRGGGPFGCSALRDAVNYANSSGALLVAAAGNSGGSTEYPGAYANVLAVAATDSNDAIASFSSVGNVAAPGVNILGAFPDCVGGDAGFTLQVNNGKACSYDYGNGTSASTPIAGGVAALVWSTQPGMNAAGVRAALESSAEDVPGTSYDGNGRISACRALALEPTVCSPVGGNPTPTPTLTPTPAPTSTPTPTPTPVPGGFQLSLAGSSENNGSTWTAHVVVAASDGGAPAPGLAVRASWSGGAFGAGVCTTEPDGTCGFSESGIRKRWSSATFTVEMVGDDPVAGPSITISKP